MLEYKISNKERFSCIQQIILKLKNKKLKKGKISENKIITDSIMMINDKSNFEDLYYEKFGFPMILCNSHKNSVQEFINLNHLNNNKLACAKCVTKERLDSDFLINIEDIFSKNPSNIIQSWPPLQDSSIYQQLISCDVQESKENLSIEQINKYFNKLKADISQSLEEHQKKVLVHINSIEQNREKVIEVYNQISSKDEIKNEFLKNQNNLSHLEQYTKQIISAKQTQSDENQSNINNALDLLAKSQQQFRFEYIEKLFKQFIISLQSIDLLNPLLTVEQQLSLRISDKKKNEDKENKPCQKVTQIMHLINNKTNFCNQKFLNNMKEVLIMNKQIFTQIDFNNPFLQESQPIQFDCLQQNELQYLDYIVKSMNTQKINTKNNHQIQQYIQNNKIFEQSLMTIQYLFKQNENKITEKIKQNLTSYVDLFEIKDSYYEDELNEIDLLESIKVKKSNYGQPEQIFFKKIENSYLLIEHNWNDSWSQVIIDQELIPEKKYQIQFELKQQNNNAIMLGLFPISQKDQPGWNSKLSLYTNSDGQGVDKIESGKHISTIKQDVKLITFQICLKEEILRCLSIVDNQKNINSLDNWDKVKQNEKYYFYIAQCSPNQKIVINQFKIINQFDLW